MNPTDSMDPPVLTLPKPEVTKWQREREAFRRLLPVLLTTHRGQYVAIHEGRVVDSGPDSISLGLRAYGQYGYVPIHVGLVTDTPSPPVRVPHWRPLG